MAENSGKKQPRRGPGRRFEPGQSGNPAGKPRGARHVALLALEAIGQGDATEIMRTVVVAAKAGDMRAAEIILRRVLPERRGRTVNLDLPEMRTTGDLVAGMGVVTAAVANGELSPEEAEAVAAVLDAQRRAIETHELAQRLVALEKGSAA